MAILNRKIVRVVLGAAVFCAVVWLAYPVVDIELRLWRNGKIAQELAQALEVRFPGVGFRGAASYKDEVVYILVAGRLDRPGREQVKSWLRTAKSEQKIAPQIRLRFAADDENELGEEVIID